MLRYLSFILVLLVLAESRTLSASFSYDQYNYIAGAVSNDGRTIYLAGLQNYNGDPVLLESTDGGKSYSTLSDGGSKFGSIATSGDGKNLVIGADDGVYLGLSLKRADMPQCATKFSGFVFYKVSMSSNGNVIAAGCRRGGDLMVSTNSGKTWNRGPNGNWATVQVSNNGNSIIAAFDNSVYISDDSGRSWAKTSFTEGFSTTASVSGDGSVFYVNQYAYRYGKNVGSIMKSTDYGATWQSQGPCIGLYPISSFRGTTVLVDSADPNKKPMLLSTDGGDSFYQSGPAGCAPWYTVGFSNQGNTIYASCGSSLYKSTNNGRSWASIGPA